MRSMSERLRRPPGWMKDMGSRAAIGAQLAVIPPIPAPPPPPAAAPPPPPATAEGPPAEEPLAPAVAPAAPLAPAALPAAPAPAGVPVEGPRVAQAPPQSTTKTKSGRAVWFMRSKCPALAKRDQKSLARLRASYIDRSLAPTRFR